MAVMTMMECARASERVCNWVALAEETWQTSSEERGRGAPFGGVSGLGVRATVFANQSGGTKANAAGARVLSQIYPGQRRTQIAALARTRRQVARAQPQRPTCAPVARFSTSLASRLAVRGSRLLARARSRPEASRSHDAALPPQPNLRCVLRLTDDGAAALEVVRRHLSTPFPVHLNRLF